MGQVDLVLLVIIATVLFSIKGFNDYGFIEKYKFHIGSILNRERIRLLSSGFLHVDYIHLFFNMYTLYLFGGVVSKYLGNVDFMVIYFGSLLTGNLYSLVNHKKDSDYSAVGASGAVSGIVFSAILLYPNMTLMMFPLPIPIPAYIFGLGYLLYSIYGMKKQLGNVGHSAHLGGSMGGFVLTLITFPEIVAINKMVVLLLGVPIVLLLIFGNKLNI